MLSRTHKASVSIYLRFIGRPLSFALSLVMRRVGVKPSHQELTKVRNFLAYPTGPCALTPDEVLLYADTTALNWRLRALQRGMYEPYETALFKQVVKRGMVVVDVGAHIGYYTLLASKLVGPSGLVYSFEPSPLTSALLKKNIRINRATNVRLEMKAVLDSTGPSWFLQDPLNSGHSRIIDSHSDAEKIEVYATSLDDFFRDIQVPVDIMKIDAEGSELKALSGMQAVIGRSRNLVIFTEFSPVFLAKSESSPEEYLERLVDCGFKLYLIDEEAGRAYNGSIRMILDYATRLAYREKYANLMCVKETRKAPIFPPTLKHQDGTR